MEGGVYRRGASIRGGHLLEGASIGEVILEGASIGEVIWRGHLLERTSIGGGTYILEGSVIGGGRLLLYLVNLESFK